MFAYVFGTPLLVLLQSYLGDGFSIGNWLAWIPWILIGYIVIRFLGKRRSLETDHKYELFPLTQLSVQEFYKNVEDILGDMRIPELTCSRVTYWEGSSVLSARREYLRISYKGLGFLICGAPFGTSFFISWREDEPVSSAEAAASVPFIGRLLALFFEKTRYRIDTEIMYRETVQGIMKHLVTTIGNDKGKRGPAELEQKPLYVEPTSPNGNH